jgi:hypothetical protein
LVRFRFGKEIRDQSGFRIVELNFLQPDVTVSQVSVASNGVATIDTSTNHGYTTGDDVRIENYLGMAWRVNGKHRITVVDANTFTFTISEADGRTAETKAYADAAKVAKLIVDTDAFTEEDPDTWTAPSGGNAGNGATLWAQNNILAPEWRGQQITASCADCHTKTGLDLKYFNYSNNSIIVRSMFHGFNEQQGKDIAAYIRGINTPNPGRPYNPVFQPCPAAATVDAAEWAGA